jgi:hypothetical protein
MHEANVKLCQAMDEKLLEAVSGCGWTRLPLVRCFVCVWRRSEADFHTPLVIHLHAKSRQGLDDFKYAVPPSLSFESNLESSAALGGNYLKMFVLCVACHKCLSCFFQHFSRSQGE